MWVVISHSINIHNSVNSVQPEEVAELPGILGTEGSIWKCVQPLQAFMCRRHSYRFIKPLMVTCSPKRYSWESLVLAFTLRSSSSLLGNNWPCLGAWLWYRLRWVSLAANHPVPFWLLRLTLLKSFLLPKASCINTPVSWRAGSGLTPKGLYWKHFFFFFLNKKQSEVQHGRQ